MICHDLPVPLQIWVLAPEGWDIKGIQRVRSFFWQLRNTGFNKCPTYIPHIIHNTHIISMSYLWSFLDVTNMAKAPWVVWADPLVPVAPHPPRSVPGSHRIPCAPSLRRGANRQWPRPCPWDVRPDRSGPPEVVPTSAIYFCFISWFGSN